MHAPGSDPDLAFSPDGGYDVSTPARQLAACRAALAGVAVVPQAYHGRGAEFCRDEMQRQAADLLRRLRDARETPTAPTSPATRIRDTSTLTRTSLAADAGRVDGALAAYAAEQGYLRDYTDDWVRRCPEQLTEAERAPYKEAWYEAHASTLALLREGSATTAGPPATRALRGVRISVSIARPRPSPRVLGSQVERESAVDFEVALAVDGEPFEGSITVYDPYRSWLPGPSGRWAPCRSLVGGDDRGWLHGNLVAGIRQAAALAGDLGVAVTDNLFRALSGADWPPEDQWPMAMGMFRQLVVELELALEVAP